MSTLLGDLLAKPVAVKPLKPAPAMPRAFVGVYTLDTQETAAVVLSDMASAAALGAALALVHPKVAADCVRTGKLDDNLLENFKEVLNIMSGLLNVTGLPHVKFSATHVMPPAPPAPLPALLAKPGGRLDITVTITGYAPGNMAILVSP